MSSSSRFLARRKLIQERKEQKKAARKLGKHLAEQGLEGPERLQISNRMNECKTVEDEREERQKVVEEHLKVFRSLLPNLLRRFERIEDPRNPKTTKHKLTVLLLYGLLAFVFQMSSRRQANREMSRPMFMENLELVFPELETLPHGDTLNRLLCNIEVDEIEATLVELAQKFIRGKKFRRYLMGGRYLIAIDGTQKFKRDYCWSEECLERHIQTEKGRAPQYYVSVLEANLVLSSGMTIPLLSEFLNYAEDGSTEDRQDCELKAFRRLAKRLKEYFPRLPITVLLDGLYPNGPIIELCRQYAWQFMIVLQDDSLPSVWEEAHGLRQIETNNELNQRWGNRKQYFWWINDIYYYYGPNERKRQTVHVVVCEETWEEFEQESNKMVQKTSRYAWISSEPITYKNVHCRCNLMARHRWAIENSFLAEKHHGYNYEHCFSYNWNAMRGYHYLMRLAHMINTLVCKSIHLARKVCSLGIRGLLQFIREIFTGPWLDAERIRYLLTLTHRIQLE